MTFTARERSALLAALHLWEYYQEPKSDAYDAGAPAGPPLAWLEQDVATRYGTLTALSNEEIRKLRQRITLLEPNEGEERRAL